MIGQARICLFESSKDGRTLALFHGDEVRDVVMMNGFR